MAEQQFALTQQDIDALARAIEEHGSKPRDFEDQFCTHWPTAKQTLEALQPILRFVPGIGAFAGIAIGVVIAAGEAAQKAMCSTNT